MTLDLSHAFARYAALAVAADDLFARVARTCPHEIVCSPGCGDCCHALFDISLIEALYLKDRFDRTFPTGPEREAVLERAGTADRDHYRLKRRAYLAEQDGQPTEAILEALARERIRCPLLAADDRCLLYDHRPVICRLYGAPLLIGGVTRTCGRTGFTPGGVYPTVKIEAMQDQLLALSRSLAVAIGSRLPLLGDMLVPVSMALLTDYDAAYLGVEPEDAVPSERDGPARPASWELPGPGEKG